MSRILRLRNVILAVALLVLFLALQVTFWLHAASARINALEYLGREVFSESSTTIEDDFYGDGKNRRTLKIPKFNKQFRMHDTTFTWNPNPHIPPDASTERSETWVGTCRLKPKSPWREFDIFGWLGPMECKLYGDWHTETIHE